MDITLPLASTLTTSYSEWFPENYVGEPGSGPAAVILAEVGSVGVAFSFEQTGEETTVLAGTVISSTSYQFSITSDDTISVTAGGLTTSTTIVRQLTGNSIATDVGFPGVWNSNIPLSSVSSSVLTGGAIQTNQVVSAEISSDAITVLQGELLAIRTAELTGVVVSGLVEPVVDSITNNFLRNVISTGQVNTVTTSQAVSFEIDGNVTTGEINEVFSTTLTTVSSIGYVGAVVSNITGNFQSGASAVGNIGTLVSTQSLVRDIDGNSASVILGDVSSTNSINIVGTQVTGTVGILVDSITVSFAASVVTSISSGIIASNQTLSRSISGNSSTTSVGDSKRDFRLELSGEELTALVNGFPPIILEENFASPVVSNTSVGNIISSNFQEKSLNSSGYRALITGYVGSVSASNVSYISGTVTTVLANGFPPIILEDNFADTVVSNVQIGSLSVSSSSNINLSGVQLFGYVNSAPSTTFVPLLGRQTILSVGNITPRTSIGLKSITSIGNITTSSASISPLSGAQSTGGIGNLTNAKYSPLTGNSTAVILNPYDDVTHSLGVIAFGQVNTVITNVSQGGPLTGVVTSSETGDAFATQTVEVIGVENTNEVGAIATALTENFAAPNVTYVQAGSVIFNKVYSITGVSTTGSVGSLATRQDTFSAITGNKAVGKFFRNFGPDLVELEEHWEIQTPGVYTIHLEGEFSYINDFRCVNNSSDMIEIYIVETIAAIRLRTPGSFKQMKMYYIDADMNYGVTYADSVPEGVDVYKMEQEPSCVLEFVLDGTYDDGDEYNQPTAGIPIRRTYLINIVVDYSAERDLVGANIL